MNTEAQQPEQLAHTDAAESTSDVRLPEPLTASSTTAGDDLLADGARFDVALQRNAEDVAAKRVACDAALAAQTAIDTELALATDESAAKVLEARRKKADADLDARRSELERAVRIGNALAAERAKVVEKIAVEASVLGVEIKSTLPELVGMVAREIAAALGPLEATLRRAWAINAAAHPGFLQHWLDEIVIPVPGTHDQFIRGDRLMVDGIVSTLRYDASNTDPKLAELFRVVHAPSEMLSRLNAYISESHLTPAEKRERAEAQVRAAVHLADARAADKAVAAKAEAWRSAPATHKGIVLPVGSM